MTDVSGPALPWGRPTADAPSAEPAIDRDLPATLSMQVGTARIEVKWELEADGGDVIMWWPATLTGRADGEPAADGEGRVAYHLTYDADEAVGYPEPTVHRATFLSAHELYDLGDDEILTWRREGDSWDESLDLLGNPGPEPVALTTQEIERIIQRHERLRGKTTEQDCADMLATLPPEHQRNVAAAFADTAQVFAQAMAALANERGPEYIIEKEDVEEIWARMRRKRERDD